MTHVLALRRLILNPVTRHDAVFMVAHWGDPEVRRFLFDGSPAVPDEIRHTIDDSDATFATAGYGLWVIRTKSNQGAIGVAGLRPLHEFGLEVFYSLTVAGRGSGYATEAAGGVIDYALGPLGLTELFAEVDDGNTASAAVIERLGMTEFATVPGALGPMIRYRTPPRAVLRYHQIGIASGWVEVDGDRTEIEAGKWISIRDHSWRLRPGVGKPIPSLPRGGRKIKQMFMTLLPMTLTRPDGSAYSLFVMYQEERGDGFTEIRCQAEQQNADGTSHRFASVEQDLHFQDDNRRFTHGTVTLIDADGTKRPLTLSAAGPTGFHLGTAGYYGWNDWVYGQWVGDLKVEGNHVTDCDKPENARELHQLRDLLVRVDDPVGGGTGFGNAETFALGAFPERGLTAENSFL